MPKDGYSIPSEAVIVCRFPLKPQSGNARNTPYGGVPFEAEQVELPEERKEPEVAEALVRRPEAVLSTLDSLKREDFAIGVMAVALGVGVAQVTAQVAQRGSAAVRGLGAGLNRSQEEGSERARLWLMAVEEDMRKQAAVSQETLKEWPDMVQASLARMTEKETAALHQLRSNMSEWAADMPENMPGVSSAVQSLWHSASDAAKRIQAQVQSTSRSSIPQVTQAAPAPALEKPEGLQITHAMPAPVLDRPKASKVTQAAPALPSKALTAAPERDTPKLLQQPQQAAQPVASLPARTSATADISVTSRGVQAALPPPEAPAAAALLPAPKGRVPKKAGRSDTQVYAAEAQAVKLKPEPVEPATAKLEDGSPKLKPEPLQPIAAKHGEKSATLQSEPVEAATPKHDNMSSKLKPELAEPVAAKRQEKSATYQPEPVAAATPKHDNISSKLKQDPVKPVAAKHEDESATLQPEPVEAATAKHSDVEAKLSPEPVEAPAANHGKKETAKQAEEVWNERIKGAYAAVAASTPYRPAAKKPSSNVLSWHRGGNTTLLKPDFQVPKKGAEEPSSGSGSGSGSAGGSGGSSSGGDDSSEPDQPEQNPREWLWARVLLAASAAAAAAEQALQWPRRRARLLALLAAAGFLAFKALESQKPGGGRRRRRKVSRNPMGLFGLGGRRSGAAGIAGGELMDFSDDESF
ncbi:g5752 [Coccomyxa viridis]|uniref:G5752 protein n=1 Tax=Coccomyxa viridis TaxID=1274662 RepID=A0ABP1FW65_9CHLO